MQIFNTKNTAFLILTLFMVSGGMSYAQSTPVEEAHEDTKESVNELVSAKDEDSPFDLALRIKTFKQVIDLSMLEVEDLQQSFSAVEYNEENEELAQWVSSTKDELADVLDYYAEQKDILKDKEDDLVLEDIKAMAEEFKEWRTSHYMPLYIKAHDFVLIQKGANILEIAKNRWDKISKDIAILDEFGFDTATLEDMLIDAGELIDNADKQHNEAELLFDTLYLVGDSLDTSSTVATSSSDQPIVNAEIDSGDPASTTPISSSTIEEVVGSVSTSTDEEDSATSTPEEVVESQNINDPSIRDLVRSSLEGTREAYRIFIEMSSFVRKLLE